jgi:hypothetical protein
MVYPNFVGGSYVSQSPLQDGEQAFNWYVEGMEGPGGKAQYALYPVPGVEVFGTSPTASGGRGSFEMAGRAFVVIGPTLYEVALDGTLTSRGTVAVDAYPATLCTNGDGGGQVFVTSGNNGYILTLATNVLTQVRTGGTRMGAHLDGYFIALDADTSTFYLSDLLDGTTWDPLQFAQRSIRPDPWVAVKILGRYIVLLGTQTSEAWFNEGGATFPFVPHPSGLIDYGTAAAFSATVVGGSLLWLGQTAHGRGDVVQMSGFSPTVVSTYALRVALEDGRMDDAIGDTYEKDGHVFYVLTLPTANLTVCYDATANSLPPSMRWTNLGTWDSGNNLYTAWRLLFHVIAAGEHLWLDRIGSSVYRMSRELTTDVEGLPIRRLRRPPALWRENQRQFVSVFEVHADVGVGATTGQGTTPIMAARFSGDGGKTFGVERGRSAGAIGEYGTRIRWVQCGSGRAWMPEIVVSDPVAWRITGASVTLRQTARSQAA